MYKDIFTQLGLFPNEATVYECLLKNGRSTVGEIIKKTPLKREVVYNILSNLIKKDLVSEKKIKIGKGKEKVAHFIPNHPEKLREYLEGEKSKFTKIENTLDANLPSLVSDFNLISGKPGVRFFEGIEGVKKVLSDSLYNNTNKRILTFSDLANYVKYLKNWNSNYYAVKRKEFNICEKAIVPDHPIANNFLKEYLADPKADKLTEVRFVDYKLYPFKTEINMYENKVSFVTFSEKNHIGVIVESKDIFNSMTSIFNALWNSQNPQG